MENYKENVKNPCFSVEKEGKLRGECVKRWWKDRVRLPMRAENKRVWNVERLAFYVETCYNETKLKKGSALSGSL
ncbi:MAG: hypothetical protein IKN72_00910 [Clostridia bacterium]|nr:hypothetical protein [Clostridia bacterium]